MNLFDYLFTDTSKTQTPAQAQANIAALSGQLAAQTDQQLAAGTITPAQAAANYAVIAGDQFTDPGAAANAAFFSGLNPFSSADPNNPNGAGIGSIFTDLFVLAAAGAAIWAFFNFGGVGFLKSLAKKSKWYAAGLAGAAVLLAWWIYSRFKKTATDTQQTVNGVASSFTSLL